MHISQAMVLAAGLGTRMRPITDRLPKPLVEIGGRTMLDRVLDHLREAGVRRVVVNVHYLADQMQQHLAQIHDLEIVISDERDLLMDSGGGVRKALPLLRDAPFFIMNSDLFFAGEGQPTNLQRLAGFFDPSRMDMALLCVSDGQTTGHNGKLDFHLSADHRLRRYKAEAGRPDDDAIVYAGAIATTKAIFAGTPEDPFSLNRLFDRAIAGGRLFGQRFEGAWITAGTPDAIAPAEETLKRFGHG